MLENAKNAIDRRDLKHYLMDALIYIMIPIVTDHVEEVKMLLVWYGIDPVVAGIVIAMVLWLARRYLSPKVLETNTTTTTATIETTEPMPDVLSPSNDTNATDTPTVSQ